MTHRRNISKDAAAWARLGMFAAALTIGTADARAHAQAASETPQAGATEPEKDEQAEEIVVQATRSGRRVGDDAGEHAVGQFGRDLEILERGLDLAGAAQSAGRVAPAEQRLETRRPAGREVDLGLVMRLHPTRRQGLAGALEHA